MASIFTKRGTWLGTLTITPVLREHLITLMYEAFVGEDSNGLTLPKHARKQSYERLLRIIESEEKGGTHVDE